MLSSSTPDLPHMKQGDKYSLSRPVSKESSMANPSFRVYYGVSGAVPFMWESQPGTPKYTFSSDTSLPPLTPPPSYYFNNINKKAIKKYSRSSKFLDALLLRINHKKAGVTTSSLSPSSSWSSHSSMSTSVPMRHSKFLSSPRSIFNFVSCCWHGQGWRAAR